MEQIHKIHFIGIDEIEISEASWFKKDELSLDRAMCVNRLLSMALSNTLQK